jgi:hypothetical protein
MFGFWWLASPTHALASPPASGGKTPLGPGLWQLDPAHRD